MTRKTKRNIRKEVTEGIISALEAGTIPWIKPWASTGGGLPMRQDTGKAYRGVNVILLMLAGMAYGSNEWYTFKQAKERGATVRKGEKGTMVVFWRLFVKNEGDEDERKIPMLRQFTVFNRDQIDGLPPLPETDTEPITDFDRHAAAETTIEATGARIKYGTGKAFYAPLTDAIGLPNPEDFDNPESFYSTAFHELAHWSGSAKRLDRLKGGSFGDELYAFEELVAEMSAAFLCAEHRIDGDLRHPEYIGHWIRKLKDDDNAIFRASKLAQAAADYISPSADEKGGAS